LSLHQQPSPPQRSDSSTQFYCRRRLARSLTGEQRSHRQSMLVPTPISPQPIRRPVCRQEQKNHQDIQSPRKRKARTVNLLRQAQGGPSQWLLRLPKKKGFVTWDDGNQPLATRQARSLHCCIPCCRRRSFSSEKLWDTRGHSYAPAVVSKHPLVKNQKGSDRSSGGRRSSRYR
jgi:hypothetical protein